MAFVPAEDLATATKMSKALHMAVVAAKSTSTMAAARDEAAPATFLAKKTQEETNEASCRHFSPPFLLFLVLLRRSPEFRLFALDRDVLIT
jgi:hypothetical protein